MLEKQRQTAAASDKLRRERWKAEETRRIKEATVKSLEPEIQRIIAKGKAEIQKLKALHEVHDENLLCHSSSSSSSSSSSFSFSSFSSGGVAPG